MFGIELLLDEIFVLQRDALQLHRHLQQRIVVHARASSSTAWAWICIALARGS